MKLPNVLVAGLASSANALKFQENKLLAAEGMLRLGFHLAKNSLPAAGTCTLDKVSVRREWRGSPLPMPSFSFINCPQTPASVAPGAKSRYDDLVVTHIQQSNYIHGTDVEERMWLERVKDLSDMVLTGHWQENTWRVPSAPEFIFLLIRQQEKGARLDQRKRTTHVEKRAIGSSSDTSFSMFQGSHHASAITGRERFSRLETETVGALQSAGSRSK
ncbi:uncharacterized protein M421DRAFT_94651 [Didymella exigua CBS 183.55]|uniref:Uncharacterized protein n=1 Tax=Didymella exigua CBS 183.55 TaxID=1150837 RepID=A0A6A5RCZ3_9PLEO|nr:uncharacterized protein M421DRAFT_94651 [Didymella exigua CBS 183.55]KAF1925572.1 hypothetical protein M421DRAFT_94651 [Didymella exigua CBS 183.55]